jgi:hypothetical protein
MRIIDNNTLRLEAENKQNTVPTPSELKNRLAKQGLKTAVLGKYFEKEYTAVDGSSHPQVPASDEVRKWEEQNTLPDVNEDVDVNEVPGMDGFTVIDDASNDDIDELPEDLKDQLGDPDHDEIKE